LPRDQFPGVELHFGFRAATVVAAPLGTEPGGGIELRNLLEQTLVPDDHYVEGHDAIDIGIRSNVYLQSKSRRVSDGLLHGLTGMRKGTPGKHGRGRERRKRELMMYGQGVPLRNNPLEGTTRFCSKPRTRMNSMDKWNQSEY
jgi:hypothetical protein